MVGWVGTWTITLALTNRTVTFALAASFRFAVAVLSDELTRNVAGSTEMEESLYDDGAVISLTWLTPTLAPKVPHWALSDTGDH